MPRQSFTGYVKKGQRAATELGYPSANIDLTETTLSGSYIARAIVEGRSYPAAVYANQKMNALEAHLLDFSGDLYGKEITIELYEKLRERESFSDVESLKKKIGEDVEKTREYFAVREKKEVY